MLLRAWGQTFRILDRQPQAFSLCRKPVLLTKRVNWTEKGLFDDTSEAGGCLTKTEASAERSYKSIPEFDSILQANGKSRGCMPFTEDDEDKVAALWTVVLLQ